MSFQNEEGLPLVEEQPPQEQKFSYKIASAIFLGVCAAMAYTSYNVGYNDGTSAVLDFSVKDVKKQMKLNKHDILPFTGIQATLPNDANGPSTNEGAKKSIVHHGFEKYEYLKGQVLAGHFQSYGKGMAQDGSPIPDEHDFEGGHGYVTIRVDFFGSIFKEYIHNGSHVTEKLGTMEGIDKQDNIVFTDGDLLADDETGVKDHKFGILQVTCGFEEHIVDYHVHSGYDNRVTVHSPHACPKDMDIPYSCHYAGTRKFKDETLKHEFGIEVECKCANHEELCRCNKVEEGYSHEDMSWCADWFNPHDFEEDRDDDHDDHDDEHHDDDHHHDDHHHDDHHDHHDDDHHHDDHHHDDHHDHHDDDHHHDDHHDDDDQHHGDRDVPVFEFDVKKDAVKKNAALAKFDSLKGKAKEASARFLHNKLAEQQKIAREQKK